MRIGPSPTTPLYPLYPRPEVEYPKALGDTVFGAPKLKFDPIQAPKEAETSRRAEPPVKQVPAKSEDPPSGRTTLTSFLNDAKEVKVGSLLDLKA